jgi:hypothetical protein
VRGRAGAGGGAGRARPLLAFFGHHKCATTWIAGLAERVCRDLALTCVRAHNENLLRERVLEASPRPDFVAYTNADPRCLPALGPYRAFHVIRDPRDIVVSAYFSHRYSHPADAWPELAAHRKRLEAVSKEEGLLLEIEFRAGEFEHLAGWDFGQPDVLELTMESLIAAPYDTMAAAFAHLDLVDESHSSRPRAALLARRVLGRRHLGPLAGLVRPPRRLPVEALLWHLYDTRFSRKTGGRVQGEEDVTSHFRKGVAGDWVNHFGPEHHEAFRQRYPGLLARLGYEAADAG